MDSLLIEGLVYIAAGESLVGQVRSAISAPLFPMCPMCPAQRQSRCDWDDGIKEGLSGLWQMVDATAKVRLHFAQCE